MRAQRVRRSTLHPAQKYAMRIFENILLFDLLHDVGLDHVALLDVVGVLGDLLGLEDYRLVVGCGEEVQ